MTLESTPLQESRTNTVENFLAQNFYERVWLNPGQAEMLETFLSSRTERPIALKSHTNPPLLLVTEGSGKCLVLWLGIDRFSAAAPDLDLALEKVDGEYHRTIRALFSQYEIVRDRRIDHERAIREAMRKNLDRGWFHLRDMDPRVVEAIQESGATIEERLDGIHVRALPWYGIFVNIHPNDTTEHGKYNTKAIWEEFVITSNTVDIAIDENNFEDDTIFGKRTNLFAQHKIQTPDEQERNTFQIRKIRSDEHADYIENRGKTWTYPELWFSVTTQENGRFFCKSITVDGEQAEFYRTSWGESLPINDLTEDDPRAGKTPKISARYFRFADGRIAVLRGTPGDTIPPRLSFAHIRQYDLPDNTRLELLTESRPKDAQEFPSVILINGVRGDYAGQTVDEHGMIVSYFIMPDGSRAQITLPKTFPDGAPRLWYV